MNTTDNILNNALHTCADATNEIVPGAGDSIHTFADEKYPQDPDDAAFEAMWADWGPRDLFRLYKPAFALWFERGVLHGAESMMEKAEKVLKG